MKNRIILLALCSLAASEAVAQSASLYEVSLDERIGQSDAIVEGRVKSQESFWNADHTRIFTANRIHVYQIFKGEEEFSSVDVITPGGIVGMKAQVVSHSLSLRAGDVGTFFLVGSRDVNGVSKWEAAPAFGVYAAEQGFIRYDELSGSASDVFSVYSDIESEVRGRLIGQLGSPIELDRYSLPESRARKSGEIPIITSFSPNPASAGTATELTISGSGFEAQGANSKVLFPNADDGGASLIEAPDTEELSWSDSEIRVRIPTRAGSGNFVVQTNGGMQATSATSLTITYNVTNIAFNGFKRSILQAKDNGGYSLVMSTDVASSGVDFATSAGVDPFERALTTWQTQTGFNMRNDGGFTNSSTVAPNDDPDIIMFDNDANPLGAGILGRAYSGYTSSNGVDWYVEGVDIQFRRDGTNNVTWNFGPASTQFCCYDFESVALHELGHAHQLGHIIDPGAVMHYSLTNGSDVRTLDPASEIDGGDDVITFSSSKPNGMTPLVGVGVEEEPVVSIRGLKLTTAFPNPAREQAVFSISVDRPQHISVDVYDVLGRRVERLYDGLLASGIEREFAVGLDRLPSGVYVYSVTGETASISRSLVLQR